MELLMMLFGVVVYIVMAWMFVSYVRNKTEIKLYRRLAIAFVILLPTWDVILGLIVYVPACHIVPKAVIYETAETDGIYYEGDYKNYVYYFDDGSRQIALANLDLEKGYKYMEALITEREINYQGDKLSVKPIIYRCIPLSKIIPKGASLPIQCSPAGSSMSGYIVKVIKVKIDALVKSTRRF